uniref:Uncharacterized protein n=1 Tax=Caenorhabditis japonica TaxID=281687 RepID=A0A8R1E8S2_CAEJA
MEETRPASVDEEILLENIPEHNNTAKALDELASKVQSLVQAIASLESGIHAVISGQRQLISGVNILNTKQGSTETLGIVSPKKPRLSCPKCQRNHHGYECKQSTPAERFQEAVKSGVCLNCNRPHPGSFKKAPACKKCAASHLTLYHC